MSEKLWLAAGIRGFDTPFAHSEELYQSAIEEFTQRGFEESSINLILTNAQMSKGQFYYYFKNKEGLYMALIDRMIQAKRQHTAAQLMQHPLQGDFFAHLRSLFAIGIDFARNHPQIERFGAAFLRERGKPIYHRALAIFTLQNEGWIPALVQSAMANGQMRSDLPLPFVSGAVGSMLGNISELGVLHGADDLTHVADDLISLLRDGLSPAPNGAQIPPTFESVAGEREIR
jgi:AcrR family transcriptional regulator